jgi:hypothetical protein
VDESLSENGPFGNGIQIQATYTLHFVNLTATYSKQRFQQLVQDDPLQYFFAFNYTTSTISKRKQAQYSVDVMDGVV